ncbi:hypothetical protein IL54_3628 [Sphingobium sp. ba1]|nr:hypothetical protein IL54_3628 [Sphingobium sp. ba1]
MVRQIDRFSKPFICRSYGGR